MILFSSPLLFAYRHVYGQSLSDFYAEYFTVGFIAILLRHEHVLQSLDFLELKSTDVIAIGIEATWG